MRFVIQRVCSADVSVEGKIIGQIGHGLLVFVGVSDNDNRQIADKMIDKLTKLRIFDDADGKTNLSISDVGGEFLIVSQFTLYADCRKGNRPSFTLAGKPDLANALYKYIISEIAKNKKSQMILFFDSLLYQHPTAEIVRKSYSISKQDKKILDDIVSSLKENNISKRNVTQSTVIRLLLQGFEVCQAMSSAECIEKLTTFQEKLTELINIYGRAEFDCLISEIVKKYSDISNEFEIHVSYIAQLYEINTYVIDFINKIQQKEGK